MLFESISDRDWLLRVRKGYPGPRLFQGGVDGKTGYLLKGLRLLAFYVRSLSLIGNLGD